MTPEAWRHQIETLQQQADALAPAAQWPGTLKEALEILQASLEELHVAEQEMLQQQEAIAVAQQAVVAAHQQYQQLFDWDPDEHVVTDRHGLIQEANQAAAGLLAISQERIVGKPFSIFVPREERRAWRTRLATLATEPRRQTWEGRLQPRRRPAFAAELTVVALHDAQGEPVRFLWLLRDLTKHLQAEEALREAHEALEQRVRERTAALAAETNAVKRLAYRMSQDLRAPLVTVQGYIRELRATCTTLHTVLPALLPALEASQRPAVAQTLDHDIPEALGFMETAVAGMASHIQAMLDFSRR
jgi:PAS domain S-box-containing protein